jgi:hypothetical protein
MYRRFSLVTAAIVLSAATNATAQDNNAALNTVSADEAKAGWTLLFDGKDISHWRNDKQDNVSDGWKIENGVLSRVDQKAGDIITKQQYGASELTLD